MDFCLLGPVTVRDNGRDYPVGGTRRRAVLAVFVLKHGRWLTLEHLAELVWGGDKIPTRNAAQAHVSRLRRVLDNHEGIGLRTQGSGYVFEVAPESVDLFRFRRLVSEARAAGTYTNSAELLRRALDNWKGAPLGGVRSEWLSTHVARELNEEWLAAVERYLLARIQLGEHIEASSRLTRLAGEYPTRERLNELLMISLCYSGRHAEALRAYRVLRQQLVDGSGMGPSSRLQELHARVLRSDVDPAGLAVWLGDLDLE